MRLRFDLLEPEPLTTEKYVCGSCLAASVLLMLWAIALFIKWTGAWLVVLSFPILVMSALYALIRLQGWKHRLLGFLSWLLLWPMVCAWGVSLLFWIAGPP